MKFNLAKLAIFVFTVLLPAVAVGISNWYVFRDSFVIATILLVITVGVAAVTTYYSGAALAKIRKYCLIFDLLICVVLCINLTSHFLLARDVSAAKEGVEDRHIEEERKAVFQRNHTEQQARLLAAQSELLKQQKEALKMEAIRNDAARKAGVRPAAALALAPVGEAPQAQGTTDPLQSDLAAITESRKLEKSLTPEDVKKHWNGWLTFWAFVDVFVAVIGGSLLASIWQWDRNGNGIADEEEEAQPQRQPISMAPQQVATVKAQAQRPNAPRH